MFTKLEMVDVVMVDGHKGILLEISLPTKYSKCCCFILVDTTMSIIYQQTLGRNVTAAWKAYKRSDFSNPCFTQIHRLYLFLVNINLNLPNVRITQKRRKDLVSKK